MLFDRERDVLVYEGPEAVPAAVACLRTALRLPGNRIAVRRSLDVLQRLRAAGLPIPAPMERYAWPGRYTPFQAQSVTANFLAATPRAFVLSDMGTGKTLAALWAADYLMREHSPGTFRTLIVAPLSTLKTVWADAIFKAFLGTRKVVILHGSEAHRLSGLVTPADFYIVNHDGLGVGAPKRRDQVYSGFARMLQERLDIQLVIVDEASAYRDATTRRHMVARELLAKRPYLWMMTGTPTPNGPLDAYGMAKLVNNAHGESYRSYHDRTMLKISQFKHVPRTGSRDMAYKLLQPAVRFSISDCVDLPPCTVQGREVEMSAEQKRAYVALKRDAQVAMGAGKLISAVNEGALRLKLLQISCGAVYDGDHNSHEIDAGPRLAAVQEIIEQCGDKIIIFAPFTNAVTMLNRKLSSYSRAIINGGVSATERAKGFKAFQDEEHPRILIADPGIMAHGLTLTAATVIIWYAPTDKTEIYLQANKRIDRPGQTKATTVVQLSASAVEREIYRRLENNESLQGALMKMMERA